LYKQLERACLLVFKFTHILMPRYLTKTVFLKKWIILYKGW